jgi:hypothetical protein
VVSADLAKVVSQVRSVVHLVWAVPVRDGLAAAAAAVAAITAAAAALSAAAAAVATMQILQLLVSFILKDFSQAMVRL